MLLKFLYIFLRRIRHCAGFGVQSPSDYAFVREVIYERSQYSRYADLHTHHPHATHMEKKLSQLLLRVSNHAQADTIAVQGPLTPMMLEALHLGCQKTIITTQPTAQPPLTIVADIHAQGKAQWQSLLRQEHTIAYDLHYLGLAFHDEKRYSEVHIINFY